MLDVGAVIVFVLEELEELERLVVVVVTIVIGPLEEEETAKGIVVIEPPLPPTPLDAAAIAFPPDAFIEEL